MFMGFSCGEDHFVSALKPLFLSPTPSFIKWVIGECVNRQESFAVFSFFSLLLYCTIAYAKQFYIFQDGKESEFPLIDETSATQQQNSIIMEVHHHLQGVADKSTDFCPVEHPMEPPDEDRPVKCPMPESSVINVSTYMLFILSYDVCMVRKNNATSFMFVLFPSCP